MALFKHERRRYIRFSVPLRVEMVLDADIECLARGEVVDFSRQGFRVRLHFSSNSALRDKTLFLKVHLPGYPTPIEIEGKVRWLQAKKDAWEIGLEIEKMDPKDKAEILEYAYKLWKEKT